MNEEQELSRLEKLPKWARDLIKTQDMRITERDKQLALNRGDPTRVRVNDHTCIGEPELYLPETSKVGFHLGEQGDPGFDYRNVIDIKLITTEEGDRAVEVRGAEAIDVLPQVSNSIIIKMRNRTPGVWRDQETGEHYVADSMAALSNWRIIAVAPYKPGVLKVHAVRPPSMFSQGVQAECLVIFVKAGSSDA